MVLYTGTGLDSSSLGYSMGFVLARIGLFSVHLTVWLTIPGASRQDRSKAASYIISSAIVITTSVFEDRLYNRANMLSGICAALVEVLAVVLWLPWSSLCKVSINAGINTQHYQARQGIAVMVALGA